jgi:hypothetical protein
MIRPLPVPTFGLAAEAFVVAHEAPGAWAKGTAVKYRQTLAALDARLAGDAPGPGADVAVLGTPAGATVLEAAFAAAFWTLAPATRARHLSALATPPHAGGQGKPRKGHYGGRYLAVMLIVGFPLDDPSGP